jgi:hypothetical protein
MFFISRDHRLRVVEGGCRFGEIDTVLPDIRFFFLGIPSVLHSGTIWENVNTELQYNFLGWPATRLPHSSLSEWSDWD